MHRSLLAWIAVGFLAAGTGCRMCANPYDECGPMSGWGCSGGGCGTGGRAGSAVSGGYVPMSAPGPTTTQPTPAKPGEPTAAPKAIQDRPESSRKATTAPQAQPPEGWKSNMPSERAKSDTY